MAKDILHDAALRAHETYIVQEGLPPQAIDMGGIIEWGGIIFDLLKKCQEKNASKLIQSAKRPGLFQTIAVNRVMANKLDAPRYVRKAKADAILKACAESDPKELQELIDTINESDF